MKSQRITEVTRSMNALSIHPIAVEIRVPGPQLWSRWPPEPARFSWCHQAAWDGRSLRTSETVGGKQERRRCWDKECVYMHISILVLSRILVWIIFGIRGLHGTWEAWSFISLFTWLEQYPGFWPVCSCVLISHHLSHDVLYQQRLSRNLDQLFTCHFIPVSDTRTWCLHAQQITRILVRMWGYHRFWKHAHNWAITLFMGVHKYAVLAVNGESSCLCWWTLEYKHAVHKATTCWVPARD